MKSQNEMILDALMKGESLTPIDALNRFSCFRLGGRIHELRQRGYDIKTEIVKDGGKSFARYSL